MPTQTKERRTPAKPQGRSTKDRLTEEPSPIRRRPPTPDPGARREFNAQMAALADTPLEGIECRANGHAPWNPARVKKIRFGWWVLEVCGNCKSERERWLDRYGLTAKQSKIHYSELFKMLAGLGHNSGVRKGAARIAYLQRHHLDLGDEEDE